MKEEAKTNKRRCPVSHTGLVGTRQCGRHRTVWNSRCGCSNWGSRQGEEIVRCLRHQLSRYNDDCRDVTASCEHSSPYTYHTHYAAPRTYRQTE